MIQKNELRIGNKVQSQGLYVTVESIHEKGINVYCEQEMGICVLEPDISFNMCDPIPLTSEIWIAAGFKIQDAFTFYPTTFTKDDFEVHEQDGGFAVFASEWTIGEPFKYLHQLQNIYYCLIGKELEINI